MDTLDDMDICFLYEHIKRYGSLFLPSNKNKKGNFDFYLSSDFPPSQFQGDIMQFQLFFLRIARYELTIVRHKIRIACFHHWKKGNCDFISHHSDNISHNSKFLSCNSEKTICKSQFWAKMSELLFQIVFSGGKKPSINKTTTLVQINRFFLPDNLYNLLFYFLTKLWFFNKLNKWKCSTHTHARTHARTHAHTHTHTHSNDFFNL